MSGQHSGRAWRQWLAASCVLCLLVSSVSAATIQQRKQQARAQFESAERMRVELNGMPRQERTPREYQRAMDAYRAVYYTAPGSSKADASVVAVAELLAESGRAFNDERSLRNAIAQYEFLRREYPGSKYRFGALFTIGQIYKDDLQDNDKARETFEEVVHRYPHLELAANAREAIAEMDQQPRGKQKPAEAAAGDAKPESKPQVESKPQLESKQQPDAEPQEVKLQEARPQEFSGEAPHGGLPQVTGIRHWSTPDYTRVAIDLEQEVKYEAGRVPDPERIFFDLHDTKLASTLVGKTFDVSDSFLRRVRVAQFQKNMVRVVLEVDTVSDYSAFFLPNPYRLIIDIHGRKPDSPQTMVARAQQAEEKRAAAPAGTHEESREESQEGSQSKATEAAATVSSGASSGSAAGPRMADGGFYSHQSSHEASRENQAPSASAGKSPAMSVAPAHAGREGSASSQTSATQTSATQASATQASATPPAEKAEASESKENPHIATERPEASGEPQKSTRSELSYPDSAEVKATDKPTTEPTVQVVAPRGSSAAAFSAGRKGQREPDFRQAQPSADGQRSLIRALGLKVGRIVIDPGHGGHDTGTIGPGGLLEKDLVLDVSLRLGRLLQGRMGADVVYTRNDDTFIPLETRTAIANQQQADLFISVHANSSTDPAARGVETYYLNFNASPDAMEVAARENAVSEKSVHELGDLVKKIALKEKIEESREFAGDVQHSLYQGLLGKDKSMRDRGVKKAPFVVLIGANMPSILAEISFVSNPGDERKLETPEYRQKIAESLYKGIARYINGLSGVKIVAKADAAGSPQ